MSVNECKQQSQVVFPSYHCINLTYPILVLFAKQAYAAVVFFDLYSEFIEVGFTVCFKITELES